MAGFVVTRGGVEVLRPARVVTRKGNDPAEWPADLRLREFPASMAGGDAVVERVPG